MNLAVWTRERLGNWMGRLYEPYRRSGLPELTSEQQDKMFRATHGIPLIIKHCYGQVYEYSRPVDVVLSNLLKAPNQAIEFSFAELFKLVSADEVQRKTLLLLALIGRPLMLRQIGEILGYSEIEIGNKLSQLVSFQCVSSTDGKYIINEEVGVFTSRW